MVSRITETQRGIALVLALLVLSFLTILGTALLTTSTIDIWISDNYKNSTQSLYAAEAGIDHARELIRADGHTLTALLTACAGPDHLLLTADDEPLIARGAGNYEVWLRNDNAEGAATTTDSNEIVTLVSTGQVGTARKTIEVTIQKGSFPRTDSDPRLQTVTGLESLANSITKNATDVYERGTLINVGSPVNYRVVVVNGNLDLGSGTGYGMLLVRGDLHIIGNVAWNGLIVVLGRGMMETDSGTAAIVTGGLFIARTQAPDGSLLAAPADVMFSITDPAQMRMANQSFPYNPIAIRER
jgi:Tfp pilus assembly protein PilX